MKDRSRKLGVILLTNLVLNTKKLSSMQSVLNFPHEEKSNFESLPPRFLYPRLMSDIDLKQLDKAEQANLLFVRPEVLDSYDPEQLRKGQLVALAKEAHKRTCQTLGVEPARLAFIDFLNEKNVNNESFSVFDLENSKIYFNMSKNYSKSRPSRFLEAINSQTKLYSIYCSIFDAIQNPDLLDDKEFFLAVAVATEEYLNEHLKRDLPDMHKAFEASRPFAPEMLEANMFAFKQTRRNFILADIYGGNLRDALRKEEQDFYMLLQQALAENCLSRIEDVVDNFTYSPLNEKSGGLLGTILKGVEKECAPAFFRSLGVQMENGTDATTQLDEIQDKILESKGIDIDDMSNEEIEDLMQSAFEVAEEEAEFDDEIDEEDVEDDESLTDEEFMQDGEDPEEEEFSPNLNVLPKEEKINNISKLPFHNNSKKDEEEREL